MSISSAVLPAFSRRSAKFLLAPAVAGAVMLSGASAVEAAPPRPSAYAQTHPVLKYGSNNSAVTYVQRRLGVRPTSGWFGPRTRAAVVRFQRRHGLAVTGVVGSRMWVKLGVRYVKRSSASSYRRPATVYSLPGVRAHVRAAANAIGPRFGIRRVGGYRPGARDPGGHPSGLAVDFMVTSRTQGNRLAAYVRASAGRYRVSYVQWNHRIWSVARAGEGWRLQSDRGGRTANHEDHVHVSFRG